MTGLLAGILALVATATADDFEKIEKQINESSRKIKSMRAKSKTTTEIKTEGYQNHSNSEGTYEFVRDGDKAMMRMESKDSGETKFGDQVQKSESTSLSVNDGEYMYTYSVVNGQKSAMKMKSQADWDANPFATMREHYDFKLTGEDKHEGAAVWVIEVTPKAGGDMAAGGKMVQWYRQDCGFPVKTIAYDQTGKPMTTNIYTDVELNASIPPDRFVFKAPEGVEVMDMDAMQQGGGQGYDEPADDDPAAEEKAKEEKKPAEKKEEKKEEKKGGLKLPKIKKP
jgi:outer membrane lipoprotein-sorting protein